VNEKDIKKNPKINFIDNNIFNEELHSKEKNIYVDTIDLGMGKKFSDEDKVKKTKMVNELKYSNKQSTSKTAGDSYNIMATIV
jgi:hypothetical protein